MTWPHIELTNQDRFDNLRLGDSKMFPCDATYNCYGVVYRCPICHELEISCACGEYDQKCECKDGTVS